MAAESSEVAPAWMDRPARWIGTVCVLAGVWSLADILFSRVAEGFSQFVDRVLLALNIPYESNFFMAAWLVLIGTALLKRKRAAWWLTLLLFEVLSIVQFVGVVLETQLSAGQRYRHDFDYYGFADHRFWLYWVLPTAMATGTIVLMWRLRPAFSAKLARGSRLAAISVAVAGVVISTALTAALTEAFPHTLHGARSRLAWSLRAAIGLTSGGREVFHNATGTRWVALLAGSISAVGLLAGFVIFMRSSRAQRYLRPDDELAVRRLLLTSGERDSLGYFATRREKSVVFSPDGKAAVTYRVLFGTSLASADPIGHPDSWPAAVKAWMGEAIAYGWVPAALSASTAGAECYTRAGLRALDLGDEAIIDVDEFSLAGRAMRQARQAVTRCRRAGYRLEVRRHAAIDPAELAVLVEVAETWRHGATERGFSMALGRLGDPADGRCVMATAYDASGELRGLLSFVPWGVRGISLDVMRHHPDAVNGITEFMVAGLAEAAGDMAIRRISLNFAVFRSVFAVGERVGAGPVLRLAYSVLSVASRFWQLESLYRSNEKYLPRWEPRFICYSGAWNLIRVALAAGAAEGFVPYRDPAGAEHDPRRRAEGTVRDLPVRVSAQEQELLRPPPSRRRISQQESVRRDKIATLVEHGMDAYPVEVARTRSLADVRAAHPALAPGEGSCDVVAVTGRVRRIRDLGGITFAVLAEDSSSLQVMLSADVTGRPRLDLFKRTVDLGDQISVAGEVVCSERGELSVFATDWVMASKCLRPLPDPRAGFSDPDARVRQRYLDLIVNADAMAMMRLRSRLVWQVRHALVQRGFAEVETPMLQAIHGGANARPFRTHINAYDTDLYLRIAPELFLKRLCVGGMGKIFELNRNFRNEGADSTHNPEFTSVEAYQAYADYTTMRELTRALVVEVATAVFGAPVLARAGPGGDIEHIDIGGDWPVVSVHDAVSAAVDAPVGPDTSVTELRALCTSRGVGCALGAGPGELVTELYEKLVEGGTGFPTFYVDFPVQTSPLARVHRKDTRLAERWDLVAFGSEIGTAYSELIDPLDQRERLVAQSWKAAAGDVEAMEVDEDFLTALEYGMPPTGGLGLGIDRLLMMMTGANIRSTLAFPFVRPPSS